MLDSLLITHDQTAENKKRLAREAHVRKVEELNQMKKLGRTPVMFRGSRGNRVSVRAQPLTRAPVFFGPPPRPEPSKQCKNCKKSFANVESSIEPCVYHKGILYFSLIILPLTLPSVFISC